MYLLGIHIGHDATAALLEDERIVAAAAEERLSRIKYHWGFPYRAIGECLRLGHISGAVIDKVLLSSTEVGPEFYTDLVLDPDGGKIDFANDVPPALGRKFAAALIEQIGSRGRSLEKRRPYFDQRLQALLEDFDIHAEVLRRDHHMSHAASAYYTSGFDRCLVVTIDGWGDGLSATVCLGEGGRLTRLHQTDAANSPGTIYAAVTAFLGFRRNKHEGKITGLAAYGDPASAYPVMSECLAVRPDKTGFVVPLYAHRKPSRPKKISWMLSHIFTGSQWVPQYHILDEYFTEQCGQMSKEEVAAGVQRVLEDTVAEHVAEMARRYAASDVALAGGVFSNVRLNQRILELPGVRRVFVHPNMGDGGLAVGASLLYLAEERLRQGQPLQPYRLADVYFGPAYSDDEIKQAVDRTSFHARYLEDVETEIARLVSAGKIVGRFNGRMEYGPRALGNRSILANPTDRSINDWLNQRLKRTEFMPFAPSTLKEQANDLYCNFQAGEYPAEFMTITFQVKEEWRERIGAVNHIDNTARPQVVTAAINPSYHRILQAYQRLTGLPTFVNTSFNKHEEPIVCTPEDALHSLEIDCVDVLAAGHWIIGETA